MATGSDRAPKPFTVAVVGGGIGGIALAIGLLHRGISTQLYEAAPAFAEIGAGIAFGPNSIRAMHLIDPAIKTAFNRLATKNDLEEEEATWINFRCGCGEPDLIAKVQTADSDKTGLSSVHRAHFLNEIAKLVPEGVANFGKRLLNLKSTECGRTELSFEDGTTAEADAVVGCDGVRSKVRQILLKKENPVEDMTFSGKYAYRGLVPMEKAKSVLGDYLAGNSQMYLGPKGSLLTYPIDHGKILNVIAFKTKENGKWEHDKWVIPSTSADLMESFQDWGTPVRNALSLVQDPAIWALFDHLPAASYCEGHVAILGDAAHASTPHQGAGAGQALEDAFILANLLGDPQVRSPSDIPAAFRAYDAIRRPRSQKVVTTSRAAGLTYGFEGPAGDDVHQIREELLQRYQWIWEEDVNQQLEQAIILLRNELSKPLEQARIKLEDDMNQAMEQAKARLEEDMQASLRGAKALLEEGIKKSLERIKAFIESDLHRPMEYREHLRTNDVNRPLEQARALPV